MAELRGIGLSGYRRTPTAPEKPAKQVIARPEAKSSQGPIAPLFHETLDLQP